MSAVDRLHGDDVLVSDAFQVSGLTPPNQGEGVNCQVEIEPKSHHGSRGAAEDGHMWLEIEVAVTFGRYEDWMVAENATVELDLAGSVTIVDDRGDPLPLDLESRTARPPDHYPGGDPPGITATQTVAVEVPDSRREFTVMFQLEARFTAEDGSVLGYQRYGQENVGTIHLTEF